MKVQKTPWCSACLNDVAEGCKYCVRGEKLVLFISGKCAVNCFYCSLSNERKNKDIVWANERQCENVNDAIAEAEENCATSAGITGGDPLLVLDRTIEYASALKKRFGEKFHIHIYLPMMLVNKERLEKLRPFVDEVRFHLEFLIKNMNDSEINDETAKISDAVALFGRKNVGVELPMLPDRQADIVSYLKKISEVVGFANLNELEISDTNINYMDGRYSKDEADYIIPQSESAGMMVLRQLARDKLPLKVHLCTAKTKIQYQYKNRLFKHKILPYGKRTKEGLVKYWAIYAKDDAEFSELQKALQGKEAFADLRKRRMIVSHGLAEKNMDKYAITAVEEYPTFDGIEIESQVLNPVKSKMKGSIQAV